jgi:hypothetical protein
MAVIREISLDFQPYIMQAPMQPSEAHKQACGSDDATMKYWRETWLKNITANKARFGSFAKNSIGQLYNTSKGRPSIIAGSGPSLKFGIDKLGQRPEDMLLVSCLHNFHYMEDKNANVDYYITLDAGPITITEVSEGGTKTPEEYWDLTKDRTLIAYIGTDPKLLDLWQGKIYFYNAPIPSAEIIAEIDAIEKFQCYVESGGCVAGSALMFTKGYLNSQVNVFVGMDLSFSNGPKMQFHSWNSSYDANIGNVIRTCDIFGNSCFSWPSYYNFKLWFEVVAQQLPGIYINATEGGILGAHRDGNIIHIKQMWLDQVFDMFSLSRHKERDAVDPENETGQPIKVLI